MRFNSGRFAPALAGLALSSMAMAAPTISTTAGEQMRIGTTSVTANGAAWNIAGVIDWDNSTSSSTFRAWWHFEVNNLNPLGETLNFSLTSSQFSDTILPVYSIDGGATYTRIPSGAGQGSFSFTLTTPPGVTSVRVAKYYPYTLTHYAAFRSSINTHPFVTETVSSQTTTLGNHLYLYEITNPAAPATQKTRIWMHVAVHPSENTAYYACEGLIDRLLDGSAVSNEILKHTIFDIVPMANPDGVQRGNYRTNANSVNLELEWGSPYNSTVPEIVFMRSKIEEFMGTSGSPGANPIRMLFNMHSSHSITYPFHFVHNGTWSSPGDLGVSPAVHNLEVDWVGYLRARSPFINLGTNQTSTLGARPYVESMMFDRYSSQAAWADVMAITIEGTYQAGPTSGVPNTPDDYRDVGEAMVLAIADYLDIDLSAVPVGLDGFAIY